MGTPGIEVKGRTGWTKKTRGVREEHHGALKRLIDGVYCSINPVRRCDRDDESSLNWSRYHESAEGDQTDKKQRSLVAVG